MRPVHFITAVLAVMLAAAAPQSANAECGQSVTFGVSSGQLLQDIGKRRSNHLGLSVMPVFTCPAFGGTVAFDIWDRFDKSGLRLNETDLELAYTRAYGLFTTEFYLGYYDLPPQPLRQGVVEFYADFGYRVVDLDWLKVKVAARPIQMVGTGGIPDLTLLRARARAEIPLNFMYPGLSLSVEPSVVYNFTRQPGQPELSFRPEVGMTWVADERLLFAVAGKSANRHKIVETIMTVKF